MPDFSRKSVTLMQAPQAIGEVKHTTIEPLREECEDFDSALKEASADFGETFMTAASPGIVCAGMMKDGHYASDDDYVTAVADARLGPEYEYIISENLRVAARKLLGLAMERRRVR